MPSPNPVLWHWCLVWTVIMEIYWSLSACLWYQTTNSRWEQKSSVFLQVKIPSWHLGIIGSSYSILSPVCWRNTLIWTMALQCTEHCVWIAGFLKWDGKMSYLSRCENYRVEVYYQGTKERYLLPGAVTVQMVPFLFDCGCWHTCPDNIKLTRVYEAMDSVINNSPYHAVRYSTCKWNHGFFPCLSCLLYGKFMEIHSVWKLLANNVNKQVAAKMDGKKWPSDRPHKV